MAKQIVTGKKVTFFDSIDFNGKILEGAYHATYNKIENGELDEDTILGTDIGGAIFFSPPTNSEHAHITHGGKIYTLGSTIKTDVPEALKNVKINANIDVDGEITDEWQNGAILLNGLENEKLTTTITSKPWEKEIDVATTNINVKDLLKIINLLCKEVAILKHGSGPISVTPKAPVAKTNLIFNGEAQKLITQEQVTGVVMKYCAKSDSSVPVPSDYTTEIPKAINAGNYTVYWLAEPASASYVLSGTTSGSISATIAQEFAVVPTITAKTGIKYGDPNDTELITVTGQAKHCTIKYKLNGGTEVTNIPTLDTLIPGEYTISWIATADEGYTFEGGQQTKSSSFPVTINKGIATLSIEGVDPSEIIELTLGTEGITITINGTNCEPSNISYAGSALRIVNTGTTNKKQIIGIDTTDETQTVTIKGVATDSSLYDNPTPIELNFIVKAAPEVYKYYIGETDKDTFNVSDLNNETQEKLTSIISHKGDGDNYISTVFIYPEEWGYPSKILHVESGNDYTRSWTFDDEWLSVPSGYTGAWFLCDVDIAHFNITW